MAGKRKTATEAPVVRMHGFNEAMMQIGRSSATTPRPSGKRYNRKKMKREEY